VRALLLIVVALAVACTPAQEQMIVRDAVVVSNTARLSIETAETAAVMLYREHQMAVVNKAHQAGATQEEATARVATVRKDWETVWDAFAELRRAHGLLVAAIQAYDTGKKVIFEGETLTGNLPEIIARAKELAELKQRISALLSEKRGAP